MTSQLESSLALSQVAGSDIFTAESIDTPWGRLFGGSVAYARRGLVVACSEYH